LTPVARSFISIPAGVFRNPLVPYTVLTAVGSAIWCFTFAGIGWGVGSSYKSFDHAFRYAEIAILVLIVAAAVAWYLRRRWTRLKNAEDPAH
jgi:membrane protein DedA with SNARE-associated domain